MTKMISSYSYSELVTRIVASVYANESGWKDGSSLAARNALDVLDERLAKHGITVGDDIL